MSGRHFSRISSEAFMSIDDLLPSAPKPQPPQADQFVMLPTPNLPLMQALAMQCLYQMAFEQAQADARAARQPARYEPGLN